jgi:hypothetical protein
MTSGSASIDSTATKLLRVTKSSRRTRSLSGKASYSFRSLRLDPSFGARMGPTATAPSSLIRSYVSRGLLAKAQGASNNEPRADRDHEVGPGTASRYQPHGRQESLRVVVGSTTTAIQPSGRRPQRTRDHDELLFLQRDYPHERAFLYEMWEPDHAATAFGTFAVSGSPESTCLDESRCRCLGRFRSTTRGIWDRDWPEGTLLRRGCCVRDPGCGRLRASARYRGRSSRCDANPRRGRGCTHSTGRCVATECS